MVKVNIIIQKVNKPEKPDLLKDESITFDATPKSLWNTNVLVRLQ